MTESPPRPEIILYDGECAVCQTFKQLAEQRLPETHFVFVPLQQADLPTLSPGLNLALANQAMYLVHPDGQRHGGARGVFMVMRQMRNPWRLLGTLFYPLAPLAEPFYRLFARYRHLVAPLFTRFLQD